MLTAYRITYSDSSIDETNMAKGITLKDAEDYFLGKRFNVGVYPEERMVTAVRVEEITP